jgi:hypothetical protein
MIREGGRVIIFAHGHAAIHAYNVYARVPLMDNFVTINNQYPTYYEAVKLVFVAPLTDKIISSNNFYVTS